MNEPQKDQETLQKNYIENPEPEIVGKRGSYKIIRSRFLGRGGFGIVFLALRQYEVEPRKFAFEQVVLKEYKKSEKWQTRDDWDKELVIMERFAGLWDEQYILKVIDIFQHKANRRYYMVTKHAPYGTLSDRIKLPMEEKDIGDFVERSASILKYLHYDVLKDYRSSEKDCERPQQSVGIIHRDFKPANIVYVEKDNQKQLYLIDFGIAKVGYTDTPKVYSNCGTNNYKAPQISETKKFNAKVDIYSFGCTLYEIFSQGERLVGSLGSNTNPQIRQRYVKSKLLDLSNRFLLMPDKIKTPNKWIEILTKCLQHEPEKRWSSKDLLAFLQRGQEDIANPFEPSKRQRQIHQKKETCQLNFQIYRVNLIQDIVFQIFQYLYFSQPRISKFVIYTLLKFVCFFIIDKYHSAKARARLLSNDEKLKLLKRLIDEKKVQEIRDKAHTKIKDEIRRERVSKTSSESIGPLEETERRFPEILKSAVPEPRRVYYELCYQLKQEILQFQQFAQKIMLIVLLMDEYDSYSEIRVDWNELKSEKDAELLSAARLYKLKSILERRIQDEGIQKLFDMCQVEVTVRSGINKDEIKTEVPIEKRPNVI